MDTFWAIALIGGVIFFFSNKARNAKVAEQENQARLKRLEAENGAIAKKNASGKTRSISKTPVKKSDPETTSKKVQSSNSKPRPSDWKPTYEGPMFSQPGEVGELFSYASYKGVHSLDAPFALIDFETSGFDAGRAKILEVAVVKIDSNGKVLGNYSTLINPGDGDVGRTDIHQISLSMVKNAPRINEIIGDLVQFIDSSIIVAHNAKFEERFLNVALRDSGINLRGIPAIDTLWLSRQVIKLPNYKLATVINGFGEKIENAHTAMGDVLAMTKILPQMLKLAKPIKYPSKLAQTPEVKMTGIVLPRR